MKSRRASLSRRSSACLERRGNEIGGFHRRAARREIKIKHGRARAAIMLLYHRQRRRYVAHKQKHRLNRRFEFGRPARCAVRAKASAKSSRRARAPWRAPGACRSRRNIIKYARAWHLLRRYNIARGARRIMYPVMVPAPGRPSSRLRP